MEDLQIEDLIKGIATGNYVKKVGSQFGSIWGWDRLLAMEATPEEYAAFGASRKVKLCHGRTVSWLEEEWSTILTYTREELRQVNIYTDPNDATFIKVSAWLESILSKGQELGLSKDLQPTALRGVIWHGRDGSVSLISMPNFQQVSIDQKGVWDSRSWWKFWG